MNPFQPLQPLPSGITLLEASAGTGKTFNIANLVARLVTEPGPGGEPLGIDEILVVTFTKDATAELRARIRSRLIEVHDLMVSAQSGALPEDPVLSGMVQTAIAAGELQTRASRLYRAIETFDLATISTIHGFCQDTLQRNAFESGLSFDAELLTQADLLRTDVVDDVLALGPLPVGVLHGVPQVAQRRVVVGHVHLPGRVDSHGGG
ncbi:MAG: UvrD-helicase domain-containing protein [Myxococcota bacterium]|nr:UvrD-helicase domain-containing protein [Myxococcota bacterium]